MPCYAMTMPCYAMLHVMPHHAMYCRLAALCILVLRVAVHVVLCDTKLCYAVLCCAMLNYVPFCYAVQGCAMLCSAMM